MNLEEIYKTLGNRGRLRHKGWHPTRYIELRKTWLSDNMGHYVHQDFSKPEDWEIYSGKEFNPTLLYGKLCWFWDTAVGEKNRVLDFLHECDYSFYKPFERSTNRTKFDSCRPLTFEELKLLSKKEIEPYLAKEA